MNRTSKNDIEAQNTILKMMGKMSLQAFAKSRKVNVGYLSAVLSGKRPASNNLRIALGLPPRTVAVTPCARCGHVHVTKRCTDKTQPTKYPKHPVMRITKIRRMLQNPYLQS